MELNIIDDTQQDTFTFTQDAENLSIINQNAMGGTELMYHSLQSRIHPSLWNSVQIIPSRVRTLNPDKPKILWLHDLAEDTEVQFLAKKEDQNFFSVFVFVSFWQMEQYIARFGIPHSKCIVLRNAIEPIPAHNKPKNDGLIRMVYFSTPQRGLNILNAAFQELCKTVDNIELHVYSSFKLYGWEHADAQFEPLFNELKAHPKVVVHDTVNNATLRKDLEKYHIFSYPSTWPETSCICAMEAMSSRLAMVCPEFGALPETTANFAHTYPWNENLSVHASMFANKLRDVVNFYWQDDHQEFLNFEKLYADSFYSWEVRAKQWEQLIMAVANG
tara:strand:+ start:6297 stop:7289 length:993 start_codon:yes stop_codon:yes gene_type:complete